MLRPRPEPRRALARGARGFTLLEVLVAMTLLGIGLALAFTAVSGSARTEDKLALHAAALQLARSKLDEALANPDFQVADGPGQEHYAGQDFGYRIRLTPVELLTEPQRQKLPAFQQTLERIDIEVFWGPKGLQQSYQLATLRAPSPPPAAPNAPPGAPPGSPPAGGGAQR